MSEKPQKPAVYDNAPEATSASVTEGRNMWHVRIGEDELWVFAATEAGAFRALADKVTIRRLSNVERQNMLIAEYTRMREQTSE